jgi:hypothetical protein
MNFWCLLSLILAAIYLVGFAALVYCAKRAPEGYEGADGFRLGVEPVKLPSRNLRTRPPMSAGPDVELANAA